MKKKRVTLDWADMDKCARNSASKIMDFLFRPAPGSLGTWQRNQAISRFIVDLILDEMREAESFKKRAEARGPLAHVKRVALAQKAGAR